MKRIILRVWIWHRFIFDFKWMMEVVQVAIKYVIVIIELISDSFGCQLSTKVCQLPQILSTTLDRDQLLMIHSHQVV